MKLNAPTIAFLASGGFSTGYDIDDDLPQTSHICWPSHSGERALCKTKRLWGYGGGLDVEVTCDACLALLPGVMKHDPEIIAKLGAAQARGDAFFDLFMRLKDWLWVRSEGAGDVYFQRVWGMSRDAYVSKIKADYLAAHAAAFPGSKPDEQHDIFKDAK